MTIVLSEEKLFVIKGVLFSKWSMSSSDRFCRKDDLCRFKFLEATETIIWKCFSETTEVILAIETILAYGSSEIDSSSIIVTETTGNHTIHAYIF